MSALAQAARAPAQSQGEPALKVVGLNKSFGGLKATSDVSFEIAEGTVTALIGPNGAGKTTVFNLITNLFRADTGDVYLYGQRIKDLPPRRIAELGLIRTFQSARVFPGMTVMENILVGRHRLIRTGAPAHLFWLPAARREERQLADRA